MNLKSSITLLSGLALLTGWSSADVPKKQPLSKYSSLWNNSPFTSKPPPLEQQPESNPLGDYALLGVSPINGGHRVTLMNKKNPEERITVDSDNPKSKFKIVKVNRKAGDPLGTSVTMMSGSLTGTVSYDEKLLTLATPKVAPNPAGQQHQAGQPPQPGQAPQAGQPQLQNGQIRQPRPRVVPPPNPGGTPAPQAAPQVQQGQPAQQNTQNQRPDRRRN